MAGSYNKRLKPETLLNIFLLLVANCTAITLTWHPTVGLIHFLDPRLLTDSTQATHFILLQFSLLKCFHSFFLTRLHLIGLQYLFLFFTQ